MANVLPSLLPPAGEGGRPKAGRMRAVADGASSGAAPHRPSFASLIGALLPLSREKDLKSVEPRLQRAPVLPYRVFASEAKQSHRSVLWSDLMAAVACGTQATVEIRWLPRPYRTPRHDVSLIYCEDTSHGGLFFYVLARSAATKQSHPSVLLSDLMAAVACEAQATVVYFTSWQAKQSHSEIQSLGFAEFTLAHLRHASE